MLVFVVAVSVALVVSFLCSIFESVLLSITHAEVESLVRQRKRSGRMLKWFKRHIDVPIAAILITNTMAHTIGTAVAGASYADAFSAESLWVFTIVFTVAVLLLTEIIPKTIGVSYARILATPAAYGIHALSVALRPLVFVSGAISRWLRGGRTAPVTSNEEIRLLASLGRTEGVIGAQTAEIIAGASALHTRSASDVMLPRKEVVFLSTACSRDEVIGILDQSRHSRFPVSRTRHLDQVTGVVLAKELLLQLQASPDEAIDWPRLMRDPLVVPETVALTSLLRTFKKVRQHMAVVVDEYGDLQGIVTLEDVLEEIVGDIEDESDELLEDLWEQDDGSFHAKASIDLRKLCRRIGIDVPPGIDVATLGGLVMQLLDRVPRQGDAVDWNGCRIEVLSASRWRPKLLSVRKTP